ncbi:DUF2948 family protein [Rhodobacteraceae bacterium NNCM2]|nr:DUF2948 family protein [Coraliihabitans acroporae]
MTDARFEDAPFSDQPIRLRAETDEDLVVIASLLQDAVLKTADIHWMPKSRRLVIVTHRFRWEDREAAERQRRPYERVQSALTINDAMQIRVRGINQGQKEAVQSLLTLGFTAAEDGAGTVSITMAEGAEILVGVECLDVTLVDLTQPWEAQATTAPSHPD